MKTLKKAFKAVAVSVIVAEMVFLAVVQPGCSQQTTKTVTNIRKLQRVHFDFDKSDIKPEYEPALSDNASWFKGNDGVRVILEGHCDERGTDEYNTNLGYRRATSVKNYLESVGVSLEQLSIATKGESKPMCVDHDELCWRQNRRVEFILQKQ